MESLTDDNNHTLVHWELECNELPQNVEGGLRIRQIAIDVFNIGEGMVTAAGSFELDPEIYRSYFGYWYELLLDHIETKGL